MAGACRGDAKEKDVISLFMRIFCHLPVARGCNTPQAKNTLQRAEEKMIKVTRSGGAQSLFPAA